LCGGGGGGEVALVAPCLCVSLERTPEIHNIFVSLNPFTATQTLLSCCQCPVDLLTPSIVPV